MLVREACGRGVSCGWCAWALLSTGRATVLMVEIEYLAGEEISGTRLEAARHAVGGSGVRGRWRVVGLQLVPARCSASRRPGYLAEAAHTILVALGGTSRAWWIDSHLANDRRARHRPPHRRRGEDRQALRRAREIEGLLDAGGRSARACSRRRSQYLTNSWRARGWRDDGGEGAGQHGAGGSSRSLNCWARSDGTMSGKIGAIQPAARAADARLPRGDDCDRGRRSAWRGRCSTQTRTRFRRQTGGIGTRGARSRLVRVRR